MTNPYASSSLLDQPAAPLPLTERYAEYLRQQAIYCESEVDRFDEIEANLLRDLAACRAVRHTVQTTLQRYRLALGPHDGHADQQWPVEPDRAVDMADLCLKCNQPMGWTERYGFVHDVGGKWEAAGEFCVQPAQDATTAMPPVEVGGES